MQNFCNLRNVIFVRPNLYLYLYLFIHVLIFHLLCLHPLNHFQCFEKPKPKINSWWNYGKCFVLKIQTLCISNKAKTRLRVPEFHNHLSILWDIVCRIAVYYVLTRRVKLYLLETSVLRKIICGYSRWFPHYTWFAFCSNISHFELTLKNN